MGDDESCVGDGICCEGGCVLASHRGAQSLCCLTDEKRESDVLPHMPEVCHRVFAPLWEIDSCKPRFGRERHRTPRTDSRSSVVSILLRGMGCCEFLFNRRCWSHHATRFFRQLNSCRIRCWPL